MFEDRILQCTQGHSVCEGCVKKINQHLKNECPQCRGAFVGTRNYILEEMVKQLKHLKASERVKKSDDANANTVANDGDEDNDKLTKAIATLVASIPNLSKRKPDDEPFEPPTRLRARAINLDDIMAEIAADLEEVQR